MTTPKNKVPSLAVLKTACDKLPNKSARIRYLNSKGMARADIGRFLGIRYQFVRNVLTMPVGIKYQAE